MTLHDHPDAAVRRKTSVRTARTRVAVGLALFLAALGAALFHLQPVRESSTLLNVSYDANREFLAEVNASFIAPNRETNGQGIQVSHAGSVRQARNLIGGNVADVAILASPPDIDEISRETGWIAGEWRERWPHGSSPYTSTIVFLVRAGNPKEIREWEDLARRDVNLVVPSPEISGAGRLGYLACMGVGLRRSRGEAQAAERWASGIYVRAEFIRAGARDALAEFLRGGRGDVLLTWENEAQRAARLNEDDVEVVYPAISILAEPVVAVIDRHVDERGTREQAEAYVAFLFSPRAQEIAARHHLRPRASMDVEAPGARLPSLELFAVEEVFGGWTRAWSAHFGPDGSFARVMLLRSALAGGRE